MLNGDGIREEVEAALAGRTTAEWLEDLHAAEVLWRARIHPEAAGTTLRAPAWQRLAEALRDQLAAAIAMDADEEEIDYVEEGGRNPFAVYDQEGRPCPRCGRPVRSFSQGGRTTFWCSGCQRRPRRDSRAGRSSR